MSFTVTKVDIWSSKIEDKPGSLAKVLGALGNVGANLDCVIARRDSAKSGSGIVFLTPVKGTPCPKSCSIRRSGACQERRDVEGRGGRCGWFGRSDLYSNWRRRNKCARCFRRGNRQEVCGILWFRQRRGRDKSGSRTKDPGKSKEGRTRQARITLFRAEGIEGGLFPLACIH